MAKSTTNIKRIEIPYFDGVNTLVAAHLSKKGELEHAENIRSKTIGTVEKREGTRRLGNEITATANCGLFYFNSDGVPTTSNGFYRISTVSATTTVYYQNNLSIWTALSGEGTSLTASQFSNTIAEENCFLVNGNDANRYIESDGTTVVTSSTITGHLYHSPVANKINYYKDRLYIADYTISGGGSRYKTGIMMSSMPLGICALINEDEAAIGAGSVVKVTDTKYIHTADILDVYRGGTKIADITTNAKTEDTITIATVTMAVGTDFEAADEVWVNGTYSGDKVFRWAGNPESGTAVKQYDTFFLTSSQNDRIKMCTNINDIMMIGTDNNLSLWNGYTLSSQDLGIGCVSDNGYVKALGSLFFIHYTGIYQTDGTNFPRLISSKIAPYIAGATKAGLEAAAMGRKGFSIFCTIGDVTLYHPDGSLNKVLSDVCLERDLVKEDWFIHTGITATQFATFIASSDSDRLEFSSEETKYPIMEFLTGQLDDRGTSDKAIPARFDTGNITLNKSFEKICYPMEVIIESERGSGIKCFVSLDNDSFYELEGEAIKGLTILKVTNKNLDIEKPPRCRQINISIRDFTKKLCKISRIAIIYSDTNEEEDNKPELYG